MLEIKIIFRLSSSSCVKTNERNREKKEKKTSVGEQVKEIVASVY